MTGQDRSTRWRATLCAGGLLLAFLGGATAEPGTQQSLRIVGRYPLPPGGSPLTDIRWASDNSVFVMRTYHGLEELKIKPELKSLRKPVPSVWELGGFDRMARLGVSGDYIAFASEGQIMAWRKRDGQGPGFVVFRRKPIALAEDIDLSGDRLVILGAPFNKEPYTRGGGIAWLGTLGADLENWKPLLVEPEGPDGKEAPGLFNCGTVALGAVRFLVDGSILVVPGFMPGAYLFDARGRRIRSWSQKEIGLDTDCRGMSEEMSTRITFEDTRFPLLQRKRVLDDIVPLPEGPGLIVRSVRADGKITWEMKVLHAQGITTWSIPIVGDKPFHRLRGDVRNGRIALLLHSGALASTHPKDYPGELILAELPQ